MLGVMYSSSTMTLSVCAIGFRSAKNHSQYSTGRLRARVHPGPHRAGPVSETRHSAVEPDAEDARAAEILDDEAALSMPLTRLGRPARSSGDLWGAAQSTRASRDASVDGGSRDSPAPLVEPPTGVYWGATSQKT